MRRAHVAGPAWKGGLLVIPGGIAGAVIVEAQHRAARRGEAVGHEPHHAVAADGFRPERAAQQHRGRLGHGTRGPVVETQHLARVGAEADGDHVWVKLNWRT
jgi:hypothetical protein